MAKPLVSIIVPVYNTERYLRGCLDSILAQEERRIEVVVVDDGSTDGSPAICDEYALRDARIRVIHQPNGGRSAARNAGLAAASGRWIGFVDSDDWIEPGMYAALLDTAECAQAPIAVCGRIEERPDASVEIAYTACGVLPTEEALEELLRDAEVRSYLCDKLICRELFDGIVFPLGRNYEDVAVVYRLFQRAGRIAFTSEHAYHYVFHGGNIVMEESLANRIDYWLAAYERYCALMPSYPHLEPMLERDVMNVNLICWGLAWGARERDAMALRLRGAEMAAFARNHRRCLLDDGSLGRIGRVCAWLTGFYGRWAFLLIMLLNRLHRLR